MTNVYHKNLSGTDLHICKLHYSTHENGGTDEVNVSGLAGRLADDQPTSIASISDIPGAISAILTDHNVSAHDALGIEASKFNNLSTQVYANLSSKVSITNASVSTHITQLNNISTQVYGNMSSAVNNISLTYLNKDGSVAMTADFDAGGHKITNASTPTSAYDVATKEYVDGLGLNSSTTRSSVTLIVAASDANHSTWADYICDGVADDEEINAAVAALPSSGGSVVLSEGNFSLSGNVLLRDNTEFYAQGYSTLISCGSYAIRNISQAGSGNYNIMVRNLRAIGSDGGAVINFNRVGVNLSSSGAGSIGGIIESVYADDDRGGVFGGVYLDYCNHIIISNCIFAGGGDAITLNNSCCYNQVTTNRILIPRDNGIKMARHTHHNIIANNYINGSRTGGCGLFGNGMSGICLELGDTHDNVIVGNIVEKFDEDGIGLRGECGSLCCFRNVVVGNIVSEVNKGGGIYLTYDSQNNMVSGNVVCNSSGHGIWLYSGGNNDNVISNNQVYNTGCVKVYHGIYLQSGDRNLVQGNIIRRGNSSQSYGIYDRGTDNLVINNDNMSSGTSASLKGNMNTGPGNRINAGTWSTNIS